MKNRIIKFIDRFYFLFKRVFTLQTYRYAVCGGSNLVLDTVLYFFFYQFIFDKQNVDLGFVVLSSHIASLFLVFPITFITGFLLNKLIVFSESDLSTRNQLVRYLMVGLGAILISYAAMKFFVDFLGFYPTVSRFMTIIISVMYSYLLQSRFSFRERDRDTDSNG